MTNPDNGDQAPGQEHRPVGGKGRSHGRVQNRPVRDASGRFVKAKADQQAVGARAVAASGEASTSDKVTAKVDKQTYPGRQQVLADGVRAESDIAPAVQANGAAAAASGDAESAELAGANSGSAAGDGVEPPGAGDAAAGGLAGRGPAELGIGLVAKSNGAAPVVSAEAAPVTRGKGAPVAQDEAAPGDGDAVAPAESGIPAAAEPLSSGSPDESSPPPGPDELAGPVPEPAAATDPWPEGPEQDEIDDQPGLSWVRLDGEPLSDEEPLSAAAGLAGASDDVAAPPAGASSGVGGSAGVRSGGTAVDAGEAPGLFDAGLAGQTSFEHLPADAVPFEPVSFDDPPGDAALFGPSATAAGPRRPDAPPDTDPSSGGRLHAGVAGTYDVPAWPVPGARSTGSTGAPAGAYPGPGAAAGPGTRRAPDPQAARGQGRPQTGVQASVAWTSRTNAKSARARKPGRAARPPQAAKIPRRAHLQVVRIEPWSVMKFSLVISVVCFIVFFVAVAVLYGALAALGVFDSVQRTIQSVTSGQGAGGVNAGTWFSASHVLGYTGLIGVINVILITALATIGAVLYNVASDLVGGIEVTLRETE